MPGSKDIIYGDVYSSNAILYSVVEEDNLILYADQIIVTPTFIDTYRIQETSTTPYSPPPDLTDEEVWDLGYAEMISDTWASTSSTSVGATNHSTSGGTQDATLFMDCFGMDTSAWKGQIAYALYFTMFASNGTNWEVGAVAQAANTPVSDWANWSNNDANIVMSGTGPDFPTDEFGWQILDTPITLDDYLFVICRFNDTEWTYNRATRDPFSYILIQDVDDTKLRLYPN